MVTGAILALKRTLLALLPRAWAGRLRAWRVHQMIRRFPRRIVEHRYGVRPLRVLIADPLARGWYDHDWTELPEIRALRGRRLRPGGRVFDIGAHQAVVALQLAREVAPGGLVVAVEPNPHNAAVGRANVALNQVRVEVVEAAVVDRPGTVILNQGLNGRLDDGSGAGGRIAVSAETVDGLAQRYGVPDVIFIDVEGAECLVLRGARRVLASGCTFVVEVHGGCGLEALGGSVAEVLEHFPADRFRASACVEGEAAFHPIERPGQVPPGRFFLLAEPAT